jgi:hypothetical protein
MNWTFKTFLLHEQTAYLGQKIGDILTAIQELRDDSKHMGTRDLVRFSQKIVNQIRRVLHSQWAREDKKHLLTLQKVGVAIMKAIEEKDDLVSVIASAAHELEQLSGRMGVPLHKLSAPDKAQPKTDDKGTAEPIAPPNSNPGFSQPQPPLGGNSGQF